MVSKEQEINIIKETKLLVELFLKTNLSDIELSKRTNISSSTVGRRLNNKDNIIKAFPINGEEIYEQVMKNRQDNLRTGKVIGGQSSILNNIQLRDRDGKYIANIPKLRLDIFYKDKEKQIQLLRHIALTFRAKLPLLVELFDFDEETLTNYLITGSYYVSFQYLFTFDPTNQEIAKANIISYYQDLLNAYRTKDKDLQKELLRKVSDYDLRLVIKKHESSKLLTDADIETIIRYQIKCALSINEVAAVVGINMSHYAKRKKEVLMNNPLLYEECEYLNIFNTTKSQRISYGKHN